MRDIKSKDINIGNSYTKRNRVRVRLEKGRLWVRVPVGSG